MRDTYNNVKVVPMIGPAALSADNTPAAVDLLGFDSARIDIAVGVGGITFSGTNKVEFKLTHSDDDSTYAAVTADDVNGVASVGAGGIVHSLIAEHAAASVVSVGYIGNKRYLKLLADFSGTHGTATPIAAVCALGDPRATPVR